jgi:hypothetical protein
MAASAEATVAVLGIVNRLRYKPGTTFAVVPDATSIHDPAVYIDMGFDVPSSTTGDASRAGCGVNIPESAAFDIDAVLALIRSRLLAFEAHELDEFLTLDGQRINDPHADSIPRTHCQEELCE